MTPNRYRELDALRGIAALMVVLFHITMGRPETRFGVTGVDLFFMISGFVIYMSLTKVNSSLEFVINRVSRLYPTYWTCVTITYIIICIYRHDGSQPTKFINYLGNMTMFQYYLGIKDLDGPYWTMIVEMNFYIGILILFHFKLLKYLNIIGVTLSVLAVIMTSFGGHGPLVTSLFTACPLLPFIPLFFAGITFYNIYENKGNLWVNYSILLIFFASRILMFHYGGTAALFITLGEYIILVTIYFSLFTLFVNGKLKFIISRGTLFLGKISYPLYLIHQYVSVDVIVPVLRRDFHAHYWLAALIAFPIVIILAFAISYYIEIPMSKRMRVKLNSLALPN
jgi:peptidoglycan/LPS O-acetylase OafA/YrhL